MSDVMLSILNTSVAIFVIVDPFAIVPVYLSLTNRFTEDQRRAIRRKSILLAGSLLLLFALTGLFVFDLFGITLAAFQIAGGILLLFLGLDQLEAKRDRVKKEEEQESWDRNDISVFPMATPLLAGPGAISTVVLHATKGDTPWNKIGVIVAIVFTMVITYFLLKIAPRVYRLLGQTGLNLMTRIMGVILTAIAIQFILNGLHNALVEFGIVSNS